MSVLTFERRTPAKDTLSAISGFCTDKTFVGHDGREYVIAKGGGKAETKNVFEVTVKIAGADKPLPNTHKYAVPAENLIRDDARVGVW